MRRLSVALAGVAVLLTASLGFVLSSPNRADAADPTKPLTPGIKPDATLNVGDTVTLSYSKPLVFDTEAVSTRTPSGCRTDPTLSVSCKAFRIAVNIDKNPLADNVIYFTADFVQAPLPPLALAVTALTLAPLNGINVYVYDWDDHYMGQNAPGGGVTGVSAVDEALGPVFGDPNAGDPNDIDPGGATFDEPERGGFSVKQKIYDIVIDATQGVNQGFSLKLHYSNEIFKTPFELLDPVPFDINNPFANADTPIDFPGSGAFNTPALPDATVLPDTDLGSIGSGIDQQFNTQVLTAIGRTRPISANAKPPSGLALIASLIAFPIAIGAGGVLVMRRRRNALI